MRSARRNGGAVLVDLINVAEPVRRAREVEHLGADVIGVHTGIDQQRVGRSPLDDLRRVRNAVKASISVAGGISRATIQEVVEMAPEIVIVGGAITSSSEPAEVAARLKFFLT